ncbi:hypothetical protein B566_EDAN010730 [Ephemera danica]|nr:hypothetical protein B566_EDAN010730 [Ephemera danica]
MNIKIVNMSENNLRAPYEGDQIPNWPNITQLFISQCSIFYIRPENFEKIKNIEVIDLSHNFLNTIPTGFEVLEKLKVLNLSHQRTDSFSLNFNHPSSIERLELDNLPITKLKRTNFSWLPKLQYLSFRSSKIVSIDENTFHDSKHLSYLDLSNNKNLKQIFPDTFLHVPSSASIILANNPQISYSLTFNFKRITMLDLSNCDLTSLPQFMFGIIEYLNLRQNAIEKWTNDYSFSNENYKILRLNISYNRIATVNSEMTRTLTQLHSVDIGENPFDCQNCDLENFRHFLRDNYDIVQNLGTKNNIYCPIIKVGKLILDTDYVCYTGYDYWLTIGTPIISIMLFLSILLTIFAFVFRFELIYMKQMWRMKRRNATRSVRYSVQCEFDSFVSYCKADRAWVMDTLVPTLEPPGDNYNLCMHERDFRIGSFIMDNIVENIERSRRVLFILSNNFLESEWCKWELRMATHRIFERGASDFLVLLELERLQRERVPLSLRVLLATRTYLEWHQNQPEVFWSRLKQTLGKPLARAIQETEEPSEPYKDVDELLIKLEILKKNPEMFDTLINDADNDIQ